MDHLYAATEEFYALSNVSEPDLSLSDYSKQLACAMRAIQEARIVLDAKHIDLHEHAWKQRIQKALRSAKSSATRPSSKADARAVFASTFRVKIDDPDVANLFNALLQRKRLSLISIHEMCPIAL